MAMMTPRTVAIASSPGRAEKLPAPPGLARLFIRKSRSRPGARASPMFGVRSRSVGPTGRTNGTEGEEPSSPKVTCIGQVRIKAGKKNKKKKPNPKPKSKPGVKCRCLQRALFCGTVFEKKKKKKNDTALRRLWPCLSMSSCHKQSYGEKRKEAVKEGDRVVALGLAGIRENKIGSEVRQKDEEPARLSNFSAEPNRLSNYNEEPARSSNYARRSFTGREEVSDQEEEEEEKDDREDDKVYVSSATTTPPKNALLLMRCRSAPQHHNRFAPSALTNIDETMEVVRMEEAEKGMGVIMEKKETNEETRVESQKESVEGEEEDEEEEEEEDEMRCSSARPLVLTRCKSEPASKGEEMMAPVGPEMASTSCFWAHTGSGSRQRKAVPGIGHEQRTSPLPSR
ncbi:protamine P1 family protein [Rhynchospora pubera]|uniref:Protamine P1 family protein n=1 Tax=Rhynchospora pubera TaxID=906938 RepID=A0AAV8EDL7_9POAL|nr:protamine P1 family protein [Rhynchospora pubera]KAJ4779338.1 protamine P1 family protein [Rhynchospora pubera]